VFKTLKEELYGRVR